MIDVLPVAEIIYRRGQRRELARAESTLAARNRRWFALAVSLQTDLPRQNFDGFRSGQQALRMLRGLAAER
jgi:hypothetical protein